MAFKKGNIPYNKGTNITNSGSFKKGHIVWWKAQGLESDPYGFKKGRATWNKGKPFPEESRQKMSRAKQGCIPWIKGRRHSEDTRRKLKVTRARQVLPIKDTKIEVAIQNGLASLGIPFKKHTSILGQPDVFIEPNICIFADGIYFHTLEKAKKNDRFVNNELTSQGYIVLRFLCGRINHNIDKVISKILSNMSDAYSKNT